jgi:PPOX class probable F420-dependent enzyme
MDINEARTFLKTNHRAVLATYHQDGRPQLTPVLVGVDEAGWAIISTRETAYKTHNMRRDPRVSLCVFNDGFFGDWIQIEGEAEVISLPTAMEGLVSYYRTVAGEHPDWEDYRAAMLREKRVLVRIDILHAGPDRRG